MTFRLGWNGSRDLRLIGLIFLVRVALMTRTILFLHRIDPTWGPHSIDRFANHLNAKLSRFNSRFWNRVVEGIDAFVRIRPGKIIMSVRLSTLFCAFCFISVIVSFRVPGYPFVAFRPFLANDLPSWKLVCSDN